MFDVMKLDFGRAVTRRKSKAESKKPITTKVTIGRLPRQSAVAMQESSLALSKEGNELQELVCTTTDVGRDCLYH